jgi:hypothetical protein
MATNLPAPATEDIWHLSIDDLLSPLPEKPRLGGPGPFVINLSSSTAGIGLPSLTLTGCESAHAYEIQRNEDGRTRYRLRLGPFESEEEADLILDMVREIYPSALTATAGADDLKTITMIRAKAAATAEARRPHTPPKNPDPPLVTTRAEPIAAKPAPAPVKPAPAAAKPVAAKPAAAPAPVPTVAAVTAKAAVVAPTAASSAKPVAAVSEPLGFNFDISIADIVSLKQPEPPTVTQRAEVPIRSAVSNFVEPPVINERVAVTIAKRPLVAPTAKAAIPPAVTQRVEAAIAKPTPARVAPAAPAAIPLTLAPVVAATPVTVAAPAPTPVATAAPISPKKPASIWESLPVAPRSTIHKPQTAAAKPSMSVSAPLVRRPAAAAAAAKPVAPPKKAAAAPIAPAMSAPKAPIAPPHVKPAMAAPVKTPTAKPAAPAMAQKPLPVPKPARTEPHVSLDSTQTMRALTAVELEDENAPSWFVIELATAKEAFDPDTVPNLDIFAEYRLYSVAAGGQNDTVHALRVGFFSAEIAAKAVASYLAEYYDKPAVKRVSLAERERFASQVVEARKDVGATGRHAVIEITDDLVARRKRVSVQTASPP